MNTETRAVAKFDLSSIPSTALVTNATLSLYCFEASNKPYDMHAYRIKGTWSPSGPLWDNRDGNWGGYMDANAAIARISVNGSGAWHNFNVTNTIKDMVSKRVVNYGFSFDTPTSNDTRLKYRSSEYATQAQRPKLVIAYSADNAAPDLVVTDITWLPAAPRVGDDVVLLATVKNQGTAATAAGTAIEVTFSIGSTVIGAGDTSTAALAAGASRVIAMTTATAGGSTWKAATAGAKFLRAEVDQGGKVSESVETNNTMNKTLTVIDPTDVLAGTSESRVLKTGLTTGGAAGKALVVFDLTDQGPARVTLCSAAGNRVAVLADGVAQAGRHVVTLDRDLRAGVYLVRMKTGGGAYSAQMLIR